MRTLVWVHNALALAPQKPDSCGAKCSFMFPTLAVVTKFSHTLSDSRCIRLRWQCAFLMSQTMSVGVRPRRDEIFTAETLRFPPVEKKKLIKQCDSPVRATPACAVHVNHATPASAVHQAGERRMHGRSPTSRVLLDRSATQMFMGSSCHDLSSADAKWSSFSNTYTTVRSDKSINHVTLHRLFFQNGTSDIVKLVK